MLVPLTPEEREELRGLISSPGAAAIAMPASIAEIEWNRKAKHNARRLALAMRAWHAHQARHPSWNAHILAD